MNIKNISLKYLLLANLVVGFLILSVLFSNKIINPVLAQSSSSDALAVRIIPNPNHLSAQRWYQLQGFSGSPQSLIVDGYKAVRDGRTVYVSATNIDGTKLYTNIYLISYDQQADNQTIDIFGRILKTWKFNTNLSLDQQVGKCLISDKTCKTNSDCPENYSCGNGATGTLAFQANKCVITESDAGNIKNTPACVLDSDCPQNLFCSGLKAKIVRDLNRLENIVLLKEKIQAYYNVNNKYPILGSGTYLPYVAVSTWPSWQNAFLNQIGANDASDPIDKLGSCYDSEGKFNLETCWNAVDNVFYQNTYNGSAVNYNNFVLPPASYAMAYITNPNGSDYKMCATMETALSGQNYVLTDGAISNNSCAISSLGSGYTIGSTGSTSNTAPYVASEKILTGLTGTEFVANIKAVDNENHPIYWSITEGATLSTWGSRLEIVNTNNPNQKMIKASYAGVAGQYIFKLKLTDNLGSSTEETFKINISNPAPQVISNDKYIYNLSYGNNFSETIDVNFDNKLGGLNNAKKLAQICLLGSNNQCALKPISSDDYLDIGNKLKTKLEVVTENNWKIKIENSGVVPVGEYKYRLAVQDKYNAITQKDFTISVTANDPIINFNGCLKIAELGDEYFCVLKTNDVNEGAIFSLVSSSLPSGLTADFSDPSSQEIAGTLKTLVDSQEIKVKATNKFGKSSEASFNLSVVSNCGNYLVEYPGGPWNSNGTIRNHGGYYKTALIGSQCWLQDNLNIGTQIAVSTSTNITNIYNPLDASTIEKYCLDNSSINCDIYGGLYTWSEATRRDPLYIKQGICPPGFRVALDSDWNVLEATFAGLSYNCRIVGGQIRDGWYCADAGAKLKYTGLNNFRALLGGYASRTSSATSFASTITSSRFMNTTESGSGAPGYREINATSTDINRVSTNISQSNLAMSVRCVKGDGGEARWANTTGTTIITGTTITDDTVVAEDTTITDDTTEKKEVEKKQ